MKKFNNQVERKTLLDVEIPIQTSTYKPITNQTLIENTLEAIDLAGLTLKSEIYYGGNHCQQSLARYGLYMNDAHTGLELAWQNSYNKSIAIKFSIGSVLQICMNGLMMGDLGNYKHKHIGDVQEVAPRTIRDYILESADKFQQVLDFNSKLKQIETNDRGISHLLGILFYEHDIINSTQLNIIKRECKNPSFDYQAKESLFEVINHVTYAMQETHPSNYITQSLKLYDFLKNL